MLEQVLNTPCQVLFLTEFSSFFRIVLQQINKWKRNLFREKEQRKTIFILSSVNFLFTEDMKSKLQLTDRIVPQTIILKLEKNKNCNILGKFCTFHVRIIKPSGGPVLRLYAAKCNTMQKASHTDSLRLLTCA